MGAWGLGLLAFILVNLLYPLSLPENVVGRLAGFLAIDPKEFSGLLAFLRFEFSPLTLKESLGGGGLGAALACWATGWLLGGWPRPHLTQGLVGVSILWGWCLLSAFHAPHRFVDAEWGEQVLAVAIWGAFALGLFLAPRTDQLERWAVRSILGTGSILLLVSAAQATRPFSDWVFTFMNRYEGPYQRNLYGALIGTTRGWQCPVCGLFFLVGWVDRGEKLATARLERGGAGVGALCADGDQEPVCVGGVAGLVRWFFRRVACLDRGAYFPAAHLAGVGVRRFGRRGNVAALNCCTQGEKIGRILWLAFSRSSRRFSFKEPGCVS